MILLRILRRLGGLPDFLRQGVMVVIRANESSFAAAMRGRAYRTSCLIDTDVVIKNWKGFQAGEGCALYHGTYILNQQGCVVLGNRSHLGAFCFVNASEGTVTIGDDVAIGPGTKIFSHSNHYATGKKVTEIHVTRDVQIGNNVFIGANCSILPGTRIADNVIIGAGSVVKGWLEPNSVYAGAPGKKIGSGWFEAAAKSVTR